MNAKQTWVYYIVKLLPTHGFLCVPESWTRIQDVESAIVLLAYPNEPWWITQKRIRNFESPGEHWNSYMAQVMYIINFDGSVIRYPRSKHDREDNCTEVENSDTSILRSLLLNTRMGSTFYPSEFYRWFHELSNSDYSGLSMDHITSQSENSINQDVVSDNDVPLDLSIKSHEPKQDWRPCDQEQVVNIPYGATSDSSTDKNWTLKHQEYSTGLIELLPNTGVYIEEVKLSHCLTSSTNCCTLARLLTEGIFSEDALKKCRYLGKKWGSLENRLCPNATDTIVNFALIYGTKHNWQRLNAEDIKRAIRYQLTLCNRNN